MKYDGLLIAGIDIPFKGAKTVIHNPKIKEILIISENKFFSGCEALNFSKDILSDKDKILLKDKSNFEIFMSIINDKSKMAKKLIKSVIVVLELIFPNYTIRFTKDKIRLIENEEVEYSINETNFEEFKEILTSMFRLKTDEDKQKYNPVSNYAKQIAEKLERGRAQAAASKGSQQKISILKRYASILAIGIGIDFTNILDNWTVYQLYDQFERYQLKLGYDMNIQARMAGAKDLEDAENWMNDLDFSDNLK